MDAFMFCGRRRGHMEQRILAAARTLRTHLQKNVCALVEL